MAIAMGQFAPATKTVLIAQEIDDGERVVVGVNRFALDEEEPYEPLRMDPALEAAQAARVARIRAGRDNVRVAAALEQLRAAARGSANVLPPMKQALSLRATVGEVSDALRDVWGVYRPSERF